MTTLTQGGWGPNVRQHYTEEAADDEEDEEEEECLPHFFHRVYVTNLT